MALRPHQALGDLAVEPGIDNREELRMRSEFIAFLKEYGVIGLAIAVVIGGKANALVTALVDGVLMPAVTFFLPSGAWRTATLDVGALHLIWGPVLGAGLGFLIVAWAGFLVSEKGLEGGAGQEKERTPEAAMARWTEKLGGGGSFRHRPGSNAFSCWVG